jgi:predicted short-subunit dehydrogenase-like oxidoreductase (DUF2520 family)
MKPVRSIAIIGYGHVGRAFVSFFQLKGVEEIVLVVRKTITGALDNIDESVKVIWNLEELKGVDLVLVCVRDEAVAEVISLLPDHIPIAYTSGSIQLDELSKTHQLGVFYPLQSFAGISQKDVAEIPILIEARNEEMMNLLSDFASQYFRRVEAISSTQRAKLHVAAVMVNNFTNHLFSLAHDWAETNKLDFSLLLPLIQETVRKINHHSPESVQTGPAIRGDKEVVQRHLAQLEGRTKELYKLFSESIAERYSSKN